MAHRHKMQHKASGGRVAYEGGASKTAHEAAEKGAARGGAMKSGGKVHGSKSKGRFARGGRAGSDKNPFSSAHRG